MTTARQFNLRPCFLSAFIQTADSEEQCQAYRYLARYHLKQNNFDEATNYAHKCCDHAEVHFTRINTSIFESLNVLFISKNSWIILLANLRAIIGWLESFFIWNLLFLVWTSTILNVKNSYEKCSLFCKLIIIELTIKWNWKIYHNKIQLYIIHKQIFFVFNLIPLIVFIFAWIFPQTREEGKAILREISTRRPNGETPQVSTRPAPEEDGGSITQGQQQVSRTGSNGAGDLLNRVSPMNLTFTPWPFLSWSHRQENKQLTKDFLFLGIEEVKTDAWAKLCLGVWKWKFRRG